MSPDFVNPYKVNGPQSARPFPKANDTTSRADSCSALKVFDLRSGKKESSCCGSSVSTEMSYSLSSGEL